MDADGNLFQLMSEAKRISLAYPFRPVPCCSAQELKARISARVEERISAQALDRLGAAFVGTIHAYCFRLFQQHVPSMRRSMYLMSVG